VIGTVSKADRALQQGLWIKTTSLLHFHECNVNLISKLSNDQLALLIVVAIIATIIGLVFLGKTFPYVLGYGFLALMIAVYLGFMFYAVKKMLELYRK